MKSTPDIKSHKVEIVSSLSKKMGEAKSLVFVEYGGMTMKGQQALKAALKAASADVIVAKNTYLRVAGKAANLPEELLTDSVLSNQTALVWGTEDAVAPIQALGKFMKDSELPKWKAGVVEGVYQDVAGLTKISKLPTKEVLYAQVVGAVAAPMYGIVGTLQGNLQKLVYLLKAKVDQSNA
ncbi:50S ribosomal protein L10 [Candidatus Woesebacteria bacterium]|jgi:large subunit ribosomal protein L10|nr:50S ribosomal protein L10 [Candidatus Woesebacteria bacterium]MBP9687454.1 50S ribosomal protein L10 [Candidatus Woesebacteria bacterium]